MSKNKIRSAQQIIESCREGDYYLRTGLADTIERMSSNEMQAFCKEIMSLIHHKDTTVGLWATDKPEAIINNQDSFFQIKY